MCKATMRSLKRQSTGSICVLLRAFPDFRDWTDWEAYDYAKSRAYKNESKESKRTDIRRVLCQMSI